MKQTKNGPPQVGRAYRLTKSGTAGDAPLEGVIVTVDEVSGTARRGYYRVVGRTNSGAGISIASGKFERAPIIRSKP